jgi:hypothetical protein
MHKEHISMKTLFEQSVVQEIKKRIAQFQPDNYRQWGKMNAGQAFAHCAGALELALGEKRPPRMILGRIIGRIVKPLAFGNDTPMPRNSSTAPCLEVEDDRNLEAERERLLKLLDRFANDGPDGCTKHPHSFFGPLSPIEWAELMYKHLDHHLRQFGA